MATMLDGMAAELRGETAPPPAATLVAMRLTSFGAGEATVVLTADEGHATPMGTVQGGLLAALADAAMGYACMTTLADGESYTTVEMKINFLKPVRRGGITARARVVKGGRTLALVTCDTLDKDERLAGYAVSTCMLLRGEAAAGR